MGVTIVVSGGNVNVATSTKVTATGSGTVENSDQSYQDTVSVDETVIIPDITITKNDDTTTTYPAAKDMDLGVIDPCVPSAPSGWDAMAAAYGIGYNYPKIGQSTSYRTGDSADIESTYFGAAVRASNGLKPRQSLISWNILNNNNVEGNTTRFLDELGGTGFTNGLVIDHWTGLMWYNVALTADTWANQIDAALASTQGGYSNWFLSSWEQLFSIIDASVSGGLNYSPFNTAAARLPWTSTTEPASSANALYFRDYTSPYTNGTFDSLTKTYSGNKGFICRKHF